MECDSDVSGQMRSAKSFAKFWVMNAASIELEVEVTMAKPLTRAVSKGCSQRIDIVKKAHVATVE